MRKLTALHNKVVFKFEQDIIAITDGKSQSTAFKEQTDWGFEFKNFDESTSKARWGTIIFVGPAVDPILQPGMRILIEHLKWTNKITFDDEDVWWTDDEYILAYE